MGRPIVFWNPARRRYLAKALSNVSLLFIGALGTSELFKVEVEIKFIIACIAAMLIVFGMMVEPPEAIKGD